MHTGFAKDDSQYYSQYEVDPNYEEWPTQEMINNHYDSLYRTIYGDDEEQPW